MATLWFIAPVATAVARALEVARDVSGPIAVLGQPRLSRALADRGKPIVSVVPRVSRARRRARIDEVVCADRALPWRDRSVAGLVAAGLGTLDGWELRLAELSRVVADGGVIALIDQGATRQAVAWPRSTELTRRALCGGLTAIEQRHVGRLLITSGVVRHLSV